MRPPNTSPIKINGRNTKETKIFAIPQVALIATPISLPNTMIIKIVNNKYARVIGNVCMDYLMINLDGIDAKIGDEVIIFSDGLGGTPTASELASFAGTINYEVICAVSKRVPRVYMRNGKIVDVMYKL